MDLGSPIADNVRVLITGGARADNESLRTELTGRGLQTTISEDRKTLDDLLRKGGKASIVVASCQPSLANALALAEDLKRERPYLPVVIYDDTVREVSRLRCVEQGLDEFVSRDEVAEMVVSFARLAATRATDATLADMKASPEEKQGEMYFQLNSDELSNALQFLCMSSRQGRLSLKFESGSSGAIFLDGGTLSHAEYENLEGIEAVARMLRGGAMEARFFEGRKASKQTNSRPISQVLIEAAVIADETSSAKSVDNRPGRPSADTGDPTNNVIGAGLPQAGD